MIFAIALFDDAGIYRGVNLSSSPDTPPAVLNGRTLRQVDLGCFDYHVTDKVAAAHIARTLHEAFEKHPDATAEDLRVAIKADAVDVARRDLNVPATTEGLKRVLRARGPGAIHPAIGAAIALRMGDDARALGLPRPLPEERERLRALFSPVEGTAKPLSIRQIMPMRRVKDALAKRDRLLAKAAVQRAAAAALAAHQQAIAEATAPWFDVPQPATESQP